MSHDVDTTTAAGAAEAAARRSYGKLIAFLAARTGDVAAAEDALSDAFAAALVTWPQSGIPHNPEAWLMAVARRKQIDMARRRRTSDVAAADLRFVGEALLEPPTLPDHRLALLFACAHPAIDPVIRAPLMLQTVLGFDAVAIASAFLISPAAAAQRLVRAKQKIREAGIPFRVPDAEEMPERLDAVLAAIYATFSGGWLEAERRNLAEEAIWLGRLIVSLLPEEPEALGLLALMLHSEARHVARRTADGAYIPLGEQDPLLWEGSLIDEAETLLRQASTKGVVGRYQLEAAIQSAHAARRLIGATDWPAIEQLYDALAAITDSPVVAVNRAIATAETRGAAAGLALLEDRASDKRLADYQPYWAARAELLARMCDVAKADEAYQRAIGLASDPAARAFLQQQRARLISLNQALPADCR